MKALHVYILFDAEHVLFAIAKFLVYFLGTNHDLGIAELLMHYVGNFARISSPFARHCSSTLFIRPPRFSSRVRTLMRDIDIAIMSVRPSVCLSVRLSVTFRYQMKTA